MLSDSRRLRYRIRRVSWVRDTVRHAPGVVPIWSHWHGIHHALPVRCRILMHWLIILMTREDVGHVTHV
jgi:hypothetical protein